MNGIILIGEEEVNPYYQEPAATIYQGHAIEVLRQLPDESVQMAVTSPPYWGLRNYSGGSDIVWGGDDCEHEWSSYTAELVHENRQGLGSKDVSPKLGIHGKQAGEANFCLKCSAWRGQLGLEPTPELYVEHLMMIFREVKRVLRKDGSFYLNIGDTYASSPKGNKEFSGLQSNNYGIGLDVPMKKNVNWANIGITPKCMVCIPERVMFAMIEDGWILRNKVIWHKPNSMPSSVKDRFTTTYEMLYFFVKERKYYFDLDAVRVPHATSSIKRANYPKHGEGDFYENGQVSFSLARSKKEVGKEGLYTKGSGVLPFNLRVRDVKRGKGGATAQNGELKASDKEIEEYEYPEQMQRHHGSGPQHKLTGLGRGLTKHDQKERGLSYKEKWDNPLGKNPGDYWELTTQPYKGAHFAVFPEKLCERPIKASSRVGDVVLDPFGGSGTTAVVAKRLGRRAILIDCVKEYCAISKERISKVEYQPELGIE